MIMLAILVPLYTLRVYISFCVRNISFVSFVVRMGRDKAQGRLNFFNPCFLN